MALHNNLVRHDGLARNDKDLQNCLDRLSAPMELSEAAKTLISIGDHVGLPLPCCLHDITASALPEFYNPQENTPSSLTSEFGWDPKLADLWRHMATDFLNAPVISHCSTTTRPFKWETCELSESDFSETMRAYGVYGGVCVPVHLPGSRVGAVGWVTRDSNVSIRNVLQRHANLLQMSAIRFMDAVLPAVSNGAQSADNPLTKREIECLTLAAQGKTHREIGALLGRSATTVRFHLDRAIEKLDAVNKVHAVAIASSLGLVRIPFAATYKTLQ